MILKCLLQNLSMAKSQNKIMRSNRRNVYTCNSNSLSALFTLFSKKYCRNIFSDFQIYVFLFCFSLPCHNCGILTRSGLIERLNFVKKIMCTQHFNRFIMSAIYMLYAEKKAEIKSIWQIVN